MAFASTLYMDVGKSSYAPGDTFVTNIRLDPNGECVNVVSGEIHFNPTIFHGSAFSQGESILTLWTEEPSIDNEKGIVKFVGGLPGSYCGRIPGDPGVANILGKVIFTVERAAPIGTIELLSVDPASQVLLADGRGTPSKVLFGQVPITIASSSGALVNEWLDDIRVDTIPPEPFTIDIYHDEATASGKYFIVFQTTDKQSGVHHYEVMERDRERPQYIGGTRTPATWKTVTSPYVLFDQKLLSDIVVRAVDNAGLIREEVLALNGKSEVQREKISPYVWIGVAAFLLALCVSVFIQKRKHY